MSRNKFPSAESHAHPDKPTHDHLPIPNDIFMYNTMIADGANGYAMQSYRSFDYGVNVTSIRETSKSGWTREFTMDRYPGQTFLTFQQLQTYHLARLAEQEE